MNQSSFQKIWISNSTRHGNRYAWRVAGKVVGAVVLAMALLTGLTFLALWLHWPMGTVSLVVCLGITALVIWMALRIGRQASRDTLIFCQDREDRLFVIDARKFVPYERGILGFFSMAAHTQKILRNLTQSGVLERYLSEKQSLVGLEPQILRVENLRERPEEYALVCRVRYPHGGEGKASYRLIRGLEDEAGLLRALESLREAEHLVEPRKNPQPARILASGLFLVVLVALCALSHPAVGQLPDTLYFPCLGLAMVALWIFLYFIIKQRRGE